MSESITELLSRASAQLERVLAGVQAGQKLTMQDVRALGTLTATLSEVRNQMIHLTVISCPEGGNTRAAKAFNLSPSRISQIVKRQEALARRMTLGVTA